MGALSGEVPSPVKQINITPKDVKTSENILPNTITFSSGRSPQTTIRLLGQNGSHRIEYTKGDPPIESPRIFQSDKLGIYEDPDTGIIHVKSISAGIKRIKKDNSQNLVVECPSDELTFIIAESGRRIEKPNFIISVNQDRSTPTIDVFSCETSLTLRLHGLYKIPENGRRLKPGTTDTIAVAHAASSEMEPKQSGDTENTQVLEGSADFTPIQKPDISAKQDTEKPITHDAINKNVEELRSTLDMYDLRKPLGKRAQKDKRLLPVNKPFDQPITAHITVPIDLPRKYVMDLIRYGELGKQIGRSTTVQVLRTFDDKKPDNNSGADMNRYRGTYTIIHKNSNSSYRIRFTERLLGKNVSRFSLSGTPERLLDALNALTKALRAPEGIVRT